MSDQNPPIIPIRTRQQIGMYGFGLLLIAIAVSSITEGGVFSRSYVPKSSLFVIVPYLLTFYLLIVLVIKSFGYTPNKFELIFIPSIVISMLYLGLYYTGILNRDSFDTDTESSTIENVDEISVDLDPNTITSLNNNDAATNISDVARARGNSLPEDVATLFTIIFIVVLFITIIAVMIYIRSKNKEIITDFSLSKNIEYSKRLNQKNKNIIELYIEASYTIENLAGMAPKWYTPTKFDNQVNIDIGPPLASYFSRLTTLYELARFSDYEITNHEVSEAKDLKEDIERNVETFIQQYMEANENN